MKKHIPNLITLLNLLCGSISIPFILNQDWNTVIPLIIVAAIADFLDGLTARFLKAHSPLGEDLDSLADMVSFGLVPGLIMYELLNIASGVGETQLINAYSLPAFLIPISAALRLARFNVMSPKDGDFIGLSTPAATAFVIGLLLIIQSNAIGWRDAILQPLFLLITTGLLSWLMVSKIKMFSLKISHLGWKGNELRYLFIILFLFLLLTVKAASVAIIMVLYVAVSTVMNFKKTSTN